ncbi:MAG TPA: translocation/assembly module TamB domain-containing protein, partial [Polyangiaceae bacterium]|nr:translocation/assembly module TamB domain-containing protein [Polyangiaceae bacterium]
MLDPSPQKHATPPPEPKSGLAPVHRRSMVRRVVRVVATIAKALGVAAAAVVLAVVFCLDLPGVRRIVVGQVNGVLHTMFAGTVTIESLAHLGLGGVAGARVHVRDPEGVQVLFVDGARVSISPLKLARSALFGKGDLEITIDDVAVDLVDLNLDVDTSGALRMARAFEPKDAKPSDPSARGTVVHLPKIGAKHVWVHGQPKGAPSIDADLDGFVGSLVSAPRRMAIDVDSLGVRTRGAPGHADLDVNVEAHFAEPSISGRERSVLAKIRGSVGGVPATVDGSMDGQDVRAELDVPPIAAENLRALVAGAPVYQDVSLHLEVQGQLPRIVAAGKITAGAGTVDLSGRATMGEETEAHATARARDIDVRAFSPTAAPSDLSAVVNVEISSGASGSRGSYVVDVPPGLFAQNRTPRVHLEGAMTVPGSGAKGQPTTAHGKGLVDEPGAKAELSFQFRSIGEASTIGFDVTSRAAALEKTRLGNEARGAVSVHAFGAVQLARASSIEAHVDVTGANLALADNRVGQLRASAHVSGPLDRPTVDGRVKASAIAAGGQRVTDATVTARGQPNALDVTVAARPVDGPTIAASSHIELGDATFARQTELVLSRGDIRAVLGVASVKVGKGRIDVDGVRIEGLGDPLQAEIHQGRQEIVVRASSNQIDLPRLSRLLQNRDLEGGHAALDVDLSVKRTRARGYARLDVDRASYERFKEGSAHVEVNVDGRRLEASIHSKLGQAGAIDVKTTGLELGEGDLLDPATWWRALGEVQVAADLDVARLRPLLPRGSVPFDEMGGRLDLAVRVERSSAAQSPALNLSMRTEGLVIAGKAVRDEVGARRVLDAPPWRTEGVDGEIGLDIAGGDGKTELRARIFDRFGDLLSFEANAARLPYASWLRGKSLDMATLMALPMKAELVVATRDLKKFPVALRTQGLSGQAGGRLVVEGPLEAPVVGLAVEAKDFASEATPGVKPLTAKIDATYEKSRARVVLSADSDRGRLLDGSVDAFGDFPRLLTRPGDVPPWKARAKLHLTDFQLESLTKLADFKMRGRLSGDLVVDDFHRDARVRGVLDFAGLRINRVEYPKARAELGFDGRSLRALLHLEQTDGGLDAEAKMAMRWEGALAPSLADDETAVMTLRAKNFRAEALLPFAASALSDLRGRIDADTRAEIAAGKAKMQGTVDFRDGRFQLNSVGEPFSGVTAKVALTPDGVVRLDSAVARGTSGRVTLSAMARLDGFDLAEAKASIGIPKNEPLPLDVDGQEIGDIDGDVNIGARASADGRRMDVKIDIPRFHVALPETSKNSAQDLKEPEGIHVGFHRRPKIFVKLPQDANDLKPKAAPDDKPPPVTNVAVHLGDDIEVRKGQSLRISLEGDPTLVLADKAKMAGQLRLKRGYLEVQGRRFEIERGSVTFVGDDPANPQILVTAGWSAPDGTRVFADFTGPLKTGKVTLRSEPGRSQNEIVALILFGQADGQSSASYQASGRRSGATGDTARAGAAAGGFASEGISKGLNDL